MIAILSIILLTTFWVLGIKVVTSEGMLMGKLAVWADEKLEKGYIIMEPLLLCPYCLPSIHSAVGYFIYWQVVGFSSWKILVAYPVVVCGASIVAGTAWSLHNLLEKKHEESEKAAAYYEKAAAFYNKAEQEKFLDLKDRTEAFKKLKQIKP